MITPGATLALAGLLKRCPRGPRSCDICESIFRTWLRTNARQQYAHLRKLIHEPMPSAQALGVMRYCDRIGFNILNPEASYPK